MIWLRCSTLEAFRRMQDTPWGDEQELIEYIKAGQTGTSNWMMDAGTAFHACLADDPEVVHEGSMLLYNEYGFRRLDVDNSKKLIGAGTNELTAYKAINVDGVYVGIRGTCDWINGTMIQDYKCKFTDADPRHYEPSLQWRFYLWIFECSCFRYNLFSFSEDDSLADDPEGDTYLKLTDTASFNFWRYPDLEDECHQWLRRFLGWAEGRQLMGYLDPARNAETAVMDATA